MIHSFQIDFPATQTGARNGIGRIMGQLKDHGLPEEDRSSVEIALAEAINNVVEHACADHEDGRVQTRCDLRQECLCVIIRDNGSPMPGLKVPALGENDLSGPRASLPEGGFGWNLIHQLTRAIDYSRSGDENRLSLCFERTDRES